MEDRTMIVSIEWDEEFKKGQLHCQDGGKKEDLQSYAARLGWECQRFQHQKKAAKNKSN